MKIDSKIKLIKSKNDLLVSVVKTKKIIKLSLSYLQFFILCDSNTTNKRTNLVSSASVILNPKKGSYAIIKNNLFSSYKYLCLLEYDVKLPNNFKNNLNLLCNNNIVISFIKFNKYFLCNINEKILKTFLSFKNITININESFYWGATTNHCMTRQILSDFVDWYYPDYLQIKTNDLKNLSWYHERLFSLYIKSRNIKFDFLNGLIHIQKNSHKILNNN
jgi:hypothetical protein